MRNLQKHIEKICRKVALKVVRKQQAEALEAGELTAASATDEAEATGATEAIAEAVAAAETIATATAAEGAAATKGSQAAAAEEQGAAAGDAPVETIVVGKDDLSEYVGKPVFQNEVWRRPHRSSARPLLAPLPAPTVCGLPSHVRPAGPRTSSPPPTVHAALL